MEVKRLRGSVVLASAAVLARAGAAMASAASAWLNKAPPHQCTHGAIDCRWDNNCDECWMDRNEGI